jgi:hypothetical protein
MMLAAISQMDPTVQAVFFAVAVVLLVLAALNVAVGKINLVAAGLALFIFVFAWNAIAAS